MQVPRDHLPRRSLDWRAHFPLLRRPRRGPQRVLPIPIPIPVALRIRRRRLVNRTQCIREILFILNLILFIRHPTHLFLIPLRRLDVLVRPFSFRGRRPRQSRRSRRCALFPLSTRSGGVPLVLSERTVYTWSLSSEDIIAREPGQSKGQFPRCDVDVHAVRRVRKGDFQVPRYEQMDDEGFEILETKNVQSPSPQKRVVRGLTANVNKVAAE